MTFQELTHGADAIVLGTVTRVLSTFRWPGGRGGTGHIVSDLEIAVTTPIKGSFSRRDRLVINVSEGTLDGVTQVLADAPDMRVGEEYALFLVNEEPRFVSQLPDPGIPRFRVSAAWLGRFRIEGGTVKPVSRQGQSLYNVPFDDGMEVGQFVRATRETMTRP